MPLTGNKIKVGSCYEASLKKRRVIVRVLEIAQAGTIQTTVTAGGLVEKPKVSRIILVEWEWRSALLKKGQWTKGYRRIRLPAFALMMVSEVRCP